MNRTLKVTGFSLKPRIRLQLEELFSRVSQVDKVFLSPDRNAAFVRLAWKSSVSFVMELRWEINNEQLNVRPAVNPTSNQNLRQPPLSDSSCISSLTDGWEKQKHYGTKCVQTYQEYCAGESQFWKDVPHQNFGQVPAGKLKRKKKQLNRNIMWSSVSVPSSEMKRGCQPKKKKKKPKSFLLPAKSFEFGVTCGKNQVSAQTPFPETVPQLQSLSSKQEEPDMQQYRAEDDLQLTNPTSCSYQEGPQDVKVFIKADKTYTLTLQRPTTPTEVCKAVSETLKVPAELLQITTEGHTLTNVVISSLQPGSTFHCTVKGNGGMQEPAQSQAQAEESMGLVQVDKQQQGNEALSPAGDMPLQTSSEKDSEFPVQVTGPTSTAIQPDATEQQVKMWLRNICRLADDQLAPFDYMDGPTLFAFQNLDSFMEIAGISSGLARKILYCRDSPEINSRMLEWSTSDVVAFIQQSLKTDRDFPDIVQKDVDGVVFLSLKSVRDFEQALGVKGMLAQRIFVERNKFLSNENERVGSTCSADGTARVGAKTSKQGAESKEEFSLAPGHLQGIMSVGHSAVDSQDSKQEEEFSLGLHEIPGHEANQPAVDGILPQNDAQPPSYIISLHTNDETAPFKLFAQNDLHLQPLKPQADINVKKSLVQCDLKVIYHKRRDLNKLEDCFLFLMLCQPNFCKGRASKDAYTKLWEIVTSSVSSLWFSLLPLDVQSHFTVEKEQIFFNDKPISYEKESTKLCSLVEFHKIFNLQHFPSKILIVDSTLLEENCKGYICELGTRKNSIQFQFGFRKSTKYWVFDPNDFDTKFQPIRVPASKAGYLLRCRYEMETGLPRDAFEQERDTDLTEFMYESTSHPHQGKSEECEDGRVINKGKPKPLAIATDQDAKEYRADLMSGTEREAVTLKWNSPRPFQNQKWKYDEGILRVIETGDGMLTPSAELKLQSSCPPEQDIAKRSFLYKSLEFVCGCLNSRQNGTIFFGVAEGNVKEKCYEYGQIVGMEMDQYLSSQYYDLFRTRIDICFPDHAEIVKLCVTGPCFIPIRNTNPQRCVIEIDVKAGAQQCRDTLFFFQPKSIFDEFSWPEKKHVYLRKQDTWTGIFRRDGSATKYVGHNEKKEFILEILPSLVRKREDEEKSEELQKCQMMSSPDAEKLKTFIEQCDTSMFPLLVLPKLSENEKLLNIEHFRFIHHIRWSAVFDFDNDSARDGIYNMSVNSNKAFEVLETVAHDFGDMSVEDRKDQLVFPKMTAWLFANGKSTGANQFERLELKKWKNRYWTYIQNAVSFYKDNSVIPPTRRLVLVLVSDEVDNGILEASQDIKTAFSWNNVLFVFNSECSRNYFAEELSDDMLSHSVCMPWQHVHHVVCECLNIKGQNRDKYVRTASGAHVPVPLNEWQSWNDLEILSTKECQDEWDGMSKERRGPKAQEEEMKFHQGKPVSWWNFFLTSQACNHVMRRSVTARILEHIDNKVRKTDSNIDRVPIVSVSHMPGAGGTTLGKSILWELKDHYKCAVIRRITGDTEREVCQFWETAEEGIDKNLLHPVILLADNLTNGSSPFDEFELCRKLYRKQKELQCANPLAILIHCHRDVKPEGDLKLTHQLTEEEKAWMEKKHKELEQRHLDDGLGTLIAFLAMRNQFDRDFLQNKVTQFIDHHSLEKNERVLIEFIALITSYFPTSEGCPALPVTACDELMTDYQYQHELARMLPWERTLSKVAQIFLVVEYRYETESPMQIVRIANQPYAKVILDTVLSQNKESLAGIVTRCLNSVLVSNKSPSTKIVIHILSKMLIERQVTEETAKITHLSPLIMEIKETDFEQAASVLQKGYNKLKNEVFYQQLARLYMTADKYDKAREFAQLAVQLSPTKRDFKHTLGLVHLKTFNALTAKVRFHPLKVKDNIEHLQVAFDALENFIAAQGKKDDDEALSICYAHCETIEVVNRVLQFLERLLPQKDLRRLGHYLTEDDCDYSLFDDKPRFREILKSLVVHGIRALRFLYFVGYSHKFPRMGVSFKTIRDARTLVYVKETSKKQFKLLATLLKTIHPSPNLSNVCDAKRDNICRLEVIKLMGCFFESIFNFFKHQQNRESGRPLVVILEKVRQHLEHITEMSFLDMDNLMTVSLALELAGQEPVFSENHSRFYKMCCEIIRAKECDDGCRMRSHMYRVLISWPSKDREDFNEEHFMKSFHHKSPPLMNRKEPVPPKVYFFVTRPDQPFYLCYWKDVYGDNDNEVYWMEMSRMLQTFGGHYKVVRKTNGEQHSRIDMSWTCAVGVLHLRIWKIRGLKVFRNENVEFFLGFSLHGPVAFIHRILPSDNNQEKLD